MPLGKRLGVPLPFYILHDVSLIKAHLISLEIPAYVGENIPKPVHLDNDDVPKHKLEFVATVKVKLVMLNSGVWIVLCSCLGVLLELGDSISFFLV